jgi:Cu+-exporting ATPase
MTPGVIKAQASAMTNAVDVEYQPERTSFEALKAAIARAGYRVAEPRAEAGTETEDTEELARQAEYSLLMRKFWFAAVISVPVMLLSYPDLVPGLRD